LDKGEDITDLGRAGLKVLQKRAGYRFGMDAVLLAAFAKARPGFRVMDLCAGCGVVSLLMYGRNPGARYAAVEIQTELAEMAARSVSINNLENYITILNGDLRDINVIGTERYDVVTANPPYLPVTAGAGNASQEISLARHEQACTIGDVCGAANRLLKSGGAFFMVHRSERLADVFCKLSENRLEPKVLRFIHSFQDSPPKLFLVKAVKDAAAGMKPEAPLVVYESPGVFTEEVNRIYTS
jgi:tRNA1(Val) A37 N6-methylase TrmN6